MRGLQWIARLLLVGACGVFLIGCGGNGEASIDYANADLSGACGLGQLTLSGGSGSGRATTDSSSWQVRLLKTAPAGGANSLVAISCQPSRGGEGKVEIGQWGPLQGKPYVMGKFFDFPQPGIDQVTAEGNSMLVWTERDPGNTSPIQCQANLVSAGLAISTDGPFLLNRVKGQSSCPPGDDGFDFNSQLQIVQQLNASSSGIEGQLVHWGAA
ncbi:MAG: hypothetical protein ACREP9_04280, partial [Candidatus Dormibacteraceae bacterium]